MTKDDASSKRPSPDPSGPKEGQEEKFTITPEMQKYISYKEAAGLVVGKLETETEQHIFLKEFKTWVKAGKHRPKMPELWVEEDPIPMKLYRLKQRGKQKLFWRDTRSKLYGKKEVVIPVKEKQTDAVSGNEIEVTVGTIQGVDYTIDYTVELGRKLLEDAFERCVNPTFYFFDSTDRKFQIKPEDFVGDLDEVLRKIRRREYTMSDSTMGKTSRLASSELAGIKG